MAELNVGTILICPDCKLRIAECIKDVPRGSVLYPSFFKSLTKTPLRSSAPMKCPECHASYGHHRNGPLMLHTQDGWIR